MNSRALNTLLALGALGLGTLVPQDRPAEGPSGPQVGKAAPAIRLNNHEGRGIRIAPPKKESDETAWTVLAFFPKAATPG